METNRKSKKLSVCIEGIKMKLRLGFVTNSSSTNHIIMWRGSQNDLQKILMEKIEMFPDHYDSYNKTHNIDKIEIVYAIISKADKAWNKQEMLTELNIRLKHAEQWYKETGKRDDTFSGKYALEHLKFIENLIEASKNKDWMLEVYFGDNEGDFEGGDLGCIMDYEGRYIHVDEEEFFYKTKQNR
jgi:hypothetical protein